MHGPIPGARNTALPSGRADVSRPHWILFGIFVPLPEEVVVQPVASSDIRLGICLLAQGKTTEKPWARRGYNGTSRSATTKRSNFWSRDVSGTLQLPVPRRLWNPAALGPTTKSTGSSGRVPLPCVPGRNPRRAPGPAVRHGYRGASNSPSTKHPWSLSRDVLELHSGTSHVDSNAPTLHPPSCSLRNPVQTPAQRWAKNYFK